MTPTESFIASFDPYRDAPAKLVQDSQALSTGKFSVDETPQGRGLFLPDSEIQLHLHPTLGEMLITLDTGERLKLTKLLPCPGNLHYHVDFELLDPPAK